ncbi:MAG: ABC transporter ATP-binding protein [Ardenticatenales bacterium]|nr:ABC transporter ATP-binding protein [Ardenticatenales bacterium]
MSPSPLLTVSNVSLMFGGVRALNDVSLEVQPGEITALIGPNGAGKSSLLNCISGLYRPTQGSIQFHSARGSQEITTTPTHQIAALGIARTFQTPALYPGLSTLDNILTARHIHMRQGLLSGLLYVGPARREEEAHRARAEEILGFLDLKHLANTPAGALSYGHRKQVDLGRALALEPELLLVDEPMAGLHQEERETLTRYLLELHFGRKVPIILVEHDIQLVMEIADHVVVLDFGSKIADGPAEEVQRDAAVIAAYLGEETH